MISFSQTGGTSGITQITISATSTQELADVVNHYTLGNESTSLDMPVVQKAYVPVQKYITMSPSAITWSSSNNTGSITINSNDSWVVVSDGWIQVSRMYESDISERYNSVSGNGNTIIGISCFENIGDARSGGITAYCQSDSAISATTTVSQAGGYVKPYITLGTYSMQVSGGSVTTAVTVQSNTTWSAITDSRWITINTLSGSGNGNVSFVVDANSSNIERRATITVFNGEINAVLVLTQAASVSRPYIILSPNSFSVPYEGSTGNTISVSANCDYDIDADVPWITVNAVSGSGNGSVSFSTSAMTGSSVGNIVFSNSAVTEYATVETAFIPYLSANTNNISSSSTGGTFEVSVYSNVNWSVSVDTGEDTPSTPWLSVTPVSGSNDGTIMISVDSVTTSVYGSVMLSNSEYGLRYEISVSVINDGRCYLFKYTSTNGQVVNPYNTTPISDKRWGANVVSNVYENNIGVITFDEPLTFIPSTAFTQAQGVRLLDILIPPCVTTIRSQAFQGLTSLRSIQFHNDCAIEEIGGSAFSGCTGLKNINIPQSVEYVDDVAFYNCSGATGFTGMENVVGIGRYAFSYCSGMVGELKLSNNLESIGVGAFRNCMKLYGHLIISDLVEEVPESAFVGCKGFSGLTLGNSIISIGDDAFSGCSGMSGNLVIPNSVESIGSEAFSQCQFSSVLLGTSLKTIKSGALRNDDAITSLVIPNSVETIGHGAFRGCSNLSAVTIGSSVSDIGDSAFESTSNLQYIYCHPITAPTLGSLVFRLTHSVGILHYPIGSDYSTFISALPSGWVAVGDITPTGDYFYVAPTGFTVDATGSTGNQITISTNLSYNISSNVNWITLSDSTGSGNKTITFDTSATTETAVTSGAITVSGSNISSTISITRQAYIPPQPPQPQIPTNEIHYTTTGGTTLDPYTTTGWGATITGNTYTDGQGILAFNRDVKSFPYNAYSNKKELQTIEIPNTVTVISGQSFIYCSKLQEVTIGSGVTSILNYAFYSCSSLATIYAHPTTAPTLGTGVFGVASSGTLHYPSGSDYSTWISALPSGWTAVADL